MIVRFSVDSKRLQVFILSVKLEVGHLKVVEILIKTRSKDRIGFFQS